MIQPVLFPPSLFASPSPAGAPQPTRPEVVESGPVSSAEPEPSPRPEPAQSAPLAPVVRPSAAGVPEVIPEAQREALYDAIDSRKGDLLWLVAAAGIRKLLS